MNSSLLNQQNKKEILSMNLSVITLNENGLNLSTEMLA